MPVLNTFIELQQRGLIDLYFADETGFSLTPLVPYGWQPRGEQKAYPCQHKGVYNLLGLLNPATQHLVMYPCGKGQTIDSQFVIQALNDFAATLTRPTVLVLDNAPVHTAAAFKAHLEAWQDQNLYVFYLPRYSPHLNLIETLWRVIKYRWLQPQHYRSKTALKNRLDHIFTSYGSHFSVNFSMNFFMI